MIKAIIFDLDGTLADTSQGIIESFIAVSNYLGVQHPSKGTLMNYIGGSLPANLKKIFNVDDDKVEELVKVYRDYYSEYGWSQSKLYPNVKSTLNDIVKRGVKVCVATMKADIFAKRMIDIWGLGDVFSSIHGVDANDSFTKTDLIKKCMADVDVGPENSVMVGDTIDDLNGAKMNGMGFIAATYGFGFEHKYPLQKNIKHISMMNQLPHIIEGM